MTNKLLETYQSIAKKSKKADEVPIEQIFKQGTLITGRYKILKFLGQGVFGIVI
jgi:hypothetical protein